MMKQMLPLVLILVCAMPAMAEDKKITDAASLDGKWKIASGEKYGEKLEGKSIEGTVTIAKGVITIDSPDEKHVMKFTIDAKATPVAITMVGEEGPAKGFTAEGIVEFKGDELKLTYALPMEKRPTAFGSKKGDKTLAFVMKPVK